MTIQIRSNLPNKIKTLSLCITALLVSQVGLAIAAPAVINNPMSIVTTRANGNTNFITGLNNAPLTLQFSPGQTTSDAIANQFSRSFGIQNPARDLIVSKQNIRNDNGQNIRYQQYYNGIPIIAGELVANTNQFNQLLSISGETSQNLNISTQARITAKQASEIALEAVARLYKIDDDLLKSSTPVLSIYDPKLISPSILPAALGWKIEITPINLLPIREFVVVNAQSGGILVHFNQVDTIKNRETYTAANEYIIPGTLVCDETDPTCAAGDADAKEAHLYAGDTYDFFMNNHNRDSIDNLGMTIASTVHFGMNYVNAFWTGNTMVYGEGMAVDDVVAHELTHGVTEHTSNLIYYYQSGAINESFSDVWGELVDQNNQSGSDTEADRWKMGEDLVAKGLVTEAFRDMANPTTKNHPDRITSILYYKGNGDGGGVHTNSAINNKAAYLLTDGGAFNGQTIKALGYQKVIKIYYEVQTNYLTRGSTYLDLYHALYKGCLNIVGTAGITNDDCKQVRAATKAVEMNKQPVEDFNPQAEVCEAGKTPAYLFQDGFEKGDANWTFTGGGVNFWENWSVQVGVASTGNNSLLGYGDYVVSDIKAEMKNDVFLPKDAKTYLHFKHLFQFPTMGWGGQHDDGGVLEYSIDSGATWADAGKRIKIGRKYNGKIASATLNPLTGRKGFVAISNGFISSRLDLESLKGQPIRFRWRIGTDRAVGGGIWSVDDVAIYTCN